MRSRTLPLLVAALLFALGGCAVATLRDPATAYEQSLGAAFVAFQKGDTGAANRALDQAADMAALLYLTKSVACGQVAQRLLEAGRPADAAQFLGRVLRDPDRGVAWDPWLWSVLADAWTKTDDRKQAAQAAAEAATRARAILGDIGAAEAGEPEAGEPGAVRRFLQAGSYFLEVREDTSRALLALREAVRRAPDNPETLNALGYALADKGKTREEFQEALKLTRLALQNAPGNPMIMDSVGWALFKNGDLAGARRILRESVDEAPDQAELRYHLGVVYAQQGLTGEADIELSRALILKPGYPEARRARALLRQAPGEGVVEDA
jgi:predicted Zn-dependent protease